MQHGGEEGEVLVTLTGLTQEPPEAADVLLREPLAVRRAEEEGLAAIDGAELLVPEHVVAFHEQAREQLVVAGRMHHPLAFHLFVRDAPFAGEHGTEEVAGLAPHVVGDQEERLLASGEGSRLHRPRLLLGEQVRAFHLVSVAGDFLLLDEEAHNQPEKRHRCEEPLQEAADGVGVKAEERPATGAGDVDQAAQDP